MVLKEADDASDTLADELLEHCKEGLARYKYPRWVNFVDDPPKTATGEGTAVQAAGVGASCSKLRLRSRRESGVMLTKTYREGTGNG